MNYLKFWCEENIFPSPDIDPSMDKIYVGQFVLFMALVVGIAIGLLAVTTWIPMN